MSLRLINPATVHEDIRGSAGIAPTFLTSALEVSGQLQGPAALHPRKMLPVPISQEAG